MGLQKKVNFHLHYFFLLKNKSCLSLVRQGFQATDTSMVITLLAFKCFVFLVQSRLSQLKVVY